MLDYLHSPTTMKLFSAIAAGAVIGASLIGLNPAKAERNYDSTCSITRISTGETTYRKCDHYGARMMDGRHQERLLWEYVRNGQAHCANQFMFAMPNDGGHIHTLPLQVNFVITADNVCILSIPAVPTFLFPFLARLGPGAQIWKELN